MNFSEEDLRHFASEVAVGYALVALDGTFMVVNPGYEELTGYSAGEMLKLRWQEITPPADTATDQYMVDRIINGDRRSYVLDKSYNRKHNGQVQVHICVAGVFGEEGKLLHFRTIAIPKESRMKVSKLPEEAPHRPVNLNFHWKILVPVVAALAAIVGWLADHQYRGKQIERNSSAIERMESTLSEILKRLPKGD